MQIFLRELLTPAQFTRFTQIYYQKTGVIAFAFRDVLAKLKLTVEQEEQVRSIINSYNLGAREIFHSTQGNLEERRKQMANLRKSRLGKIITLLTDEQKKTWNELIGTPFEMQKEDTRNN